VKKYDALSDFDDEDLEGTFTSIEEEVAKLKERHTNVWSVFSGVQNKQDLEAMQQWLRPEDVRQDFYDALNDFSKTLQLAMSSAKFHEETPTAILRRESCPPAIVVARPVPDSGACNPLGPGPIAAGPCAARRPDCGCRPT
jgi:hypothetical protein